MKEVFERTFQSRHRECERSKNICKILCVFLFIVFCSLELFCGVFPSRSFSRAQLCLSVQSASPSECAHVGKNEMGGERLASSLALSRCSTLPLTVMTVWMNESPSTQRNSQSLVRHRGEILNRSVGREMISTLFVLKTQHSTTHSPLLESCVVSDHLNKPKKKYKKVLIHLNSRFGSSVAERSQGVCTSKWCFGLPRLQVIAFFSLMSSVIPIACQLNLLT